MAPRPMCTPRTDGDAEAPELSTLADPKGNEVDIAVTVGREELSQLPPRGKLPNPATTIPDRRRLRSTRPPLSSCDRRPARPAADRPQPDGTATPNVNAERQRRGRSDPHRTGMSAAGAQS